MFCLTMIVIIESYNSKSEEIQPSDSGYDNVKTASLHKINDSTTLPLI